MSQEMNKQAVADLFCIEDARAVCEAIGGLGLNQGDEFTDDPLEYTPDNILDVKVNENPDGMPAFPQVGQTDMDDETKAFVVDELAKQLQADGRDTLSEEDLVPFAVKIKGENHISQDLVSFIDQLTSGADARLSTQNTSEAQPNGVATDLTGGGEGPVSNGAPESGLGPDGLPPVAPGGIAEPTEAPALDTNTEDVPGLDVPPADTAAGDEFNLDVPEPGNEVGPEGGEDEFTLDIPGEDEGSSAEGDSTDTIGELDFGDEGDEGGTESPVKEGDDDGSSEDDLFSALDGMSDESLDDGTDDGETESKDEGKEDDKPAETESVEAPAEPVTECGAEPAGEPVTECGTEPAAEPAAEPVTECGTEPAAEPAAEAGMDNIPNDVPLDEAVDAKLESIKANYVEKVARDRVRAVVESYQQKRALAEKRALCESIIADYKARKESEARKAVVESTLGEKIGELGNRVASVCENASASKELDAKLESIVSDFKATKAKEAASKELDAKLESIVSKFHAGKSDKGAEPVMESVTEPKVAPVSKHSGLDAKLESIIADTKARLAAAK